MGRSRPSTAAVLRALGVLSAALALSCLGPCGGAESPHCAEPDDPAPSAVYGRCRRAGPDLPLAPGTERQAAEALPESFRGWFPYFGFVNRYHMADVDRHGLYIDFGTAHRFKYTLGDWAAGWAVDERDGGDDFTWAADGARDGSPDAAHHVLFHLDRAVPLTFRMRYRSPVRRTLSVDVNGAYAFTWTLEPGRWIVVEQALPAEALRAGENRLRLSHDATAPLVRRGRRVFFRVDWMWFLADPAAADAEGAAPADSAVVQETTLREGDGAVGRPSLVLPVPATLSYYVDAPAGAGSASVVAFVGFAYGTTGPLEAPAGPVTFEISVAADGGPREVVWSRTVESGSAGRWLSDSTGSLARYAGRFVRIDLAVRGAPGPGWRAVWGAPTLFVPRRPCPAPRPAAPRNVIVLVIDALRADHTEPYEAPWMFPRVAWHGGDVRTPALRAIAAQGVLFDSALAADNWTLPSVTSLLTGLHPRTHGVLRETDALAPRVPLLPEILHGQGFRTAAFVANVRIAGGTGFDRGWDVFRNYVDLLELRRAEDLFRDALRWLREGRDRPFFLYLHTIEPHVPYLPPEEYVALYDPGPYSGPVEPRDTPDLLERLRLGQTTLDERDRARLHALYCGEVTQHDDDLGVFWRALAAEGLLRDTLVIVTADHGEEFFEHGRAGHGQTLFQETLHVPLVFRLPGLPGPRHVRDHVGLVDVAPTIVDLLDLGPAADAQGIGFDGCSLVPQILGWPVAGPVAVLASSRGERAAVVAGGWKLLAAGPTQSALLPVIAGRIEPVLFLPDGTVDWEAMDAAARGRPVTARALRILLGQYLGAPDLGRWRSPLAASSPARSFAPAAAVYEHDTEALLRAIGYVR